MGKNLKWLRSMMTLRQFKTIADKTNHLHVKVDSVNRNTKALLNAVKNDRTVDQVR